MRRIDNEDRRQSSGVNLSEYWRIIWKKKAYLAIPVILAGVVTVLGVQFLKPVYKSASLIRLEDPNLVAPELAEFLTMEERRQAVDEETLARIRAEIRSSGFVDQVVDYLGLDENPQAIDRARELKESRYPDLSVQEILRRNLREILSNKIRVSLEGPGLFEIATYDYSPRTCYQLASAVTTLFIDAQRQKQLRGLEEAGEFSDEQLEVYKERLENSERQLEDVQSRITDLALQSNPVGETSKQYQEEFGGESNLRYAETLKEQLDVTISELEGVIARTGQRIRTGTSATLPDNLLRTNSDLNKLINTLIRYRETQLRLELGNRGVTTADLDANRGRVRETEKAIERQLTTIVSARFDDVDRDYRPLIVEYYLQRGIVESLRSKRDRLASYIDAFKRKLDLVPQLQTELARLEDQVNTDRELYNSFLRAKTSAQIGQAAQKTNLGLSVDVLEPAAQPLTPERPRKKRILLLALIIGATLGAGGILLSEYMDTSFRDIADIEKQLDLRVLGTIPQIEANAAWSSVPTRRQSLIWAGTAAVVIILAVTGFYLYGRSADRVVVSGAEKAQYQDLDSNTDEGVPVE